MEGGKETGREEKGGGRGAIRETDRQTDKGKEGEMSKQQRP